MDNFVWYIHVKVEDPTFVALSIQHMLSKFWGDVQYRAVERSLGWGFKSIYINFISLCMIFLCIFDVGGLQRLTISPN